jgi:hypothetical protein
VGPTAFRESIVKEHPAPEGSTPFIRQSARHLGQNSPVWCSAASKDANSVHNIRMNGVGQERIAEYEAVGDLDDVVIVSKIGMKGISTPVEGVWDGMMGISVAIKGVTAKKMGISAAETGMISPWIPFLGAQRGSFPIWVGSISPLPPSTGALPGSFGGVTPSSGTSPGNHGALPGFSPCGSGTVLPQCGNPGGAPGVPTPHPSEVSP